MTYPSPRGRFRAGPRLRRMGLAPAAAVLCGAAVLAAPALAQADPTVTASAPSAITTNGALLQVTVNPSGQDTLYQINYGPTCTQLTSSTGYHDGGSSTSPVTESATVDGLTPNSSYCVQAEIFQNSTQVDLKSNTVTFTTASNPTGPGNPIVSPQFPPANGIFGDGCTTDAQCLGDINGVRAAQEQLAPLVLPTNWTQLTQPEQMFVATNLERLSRGLTAIPNLVNAYDADVQTGVANDADPDLSDFTNNGAGWNWESIWAGGQANVLAAMYGWLYDDGFNSGNLDCTSPTAQGCWGHRNAILDNPAGNLNPTEMDAVVGTDNNGTASYAAAFTNNTATTPGSVVMTWASEQGFLAPPPLGGLGARGAVPVDRSVHLSRARFRGLGGRKVPALFFNLGTQSAFGTVISYVDSQPGVTTVTVRRVFSGVRRHGRCVAGSPVRGKRSAACIRTVVVGSFTHADTRGENRFRYVGRIDGLKLRPGRYEMTLVPRTSLGRFGRAVTRMFTVVR